MDTISRSASSFHRSDSCSNDYLDEYIRVFCSCDNAQWSTIVRIVCPIDVYVQGFFTRSYYLFFFFFSSFLCPFIFTRRSLFTSKWPWSCSNIYIRKEGERVQAVFSFFLFHSFSRNSSVVYVCMLARDQWMDITSHINIRVHTHYQEKRSKVEARIKTYSNFFFSFPPFFVLHQE